MTTPTLFPATARNHATFTALMRACSYPGQVQRLPHGGLGAYIAIAEALVDLETSYHTTDAELAPLLARSGGRALPPDTARYHFYPTLGTPALAALTQAPIGTYIAPEESALLVVGARFGTGPLLHLRGPGIQTSTTVRVSVPAALWEARIRALRYPLGWDLLLVDDAQVLGLPRTTLVEGF